MAEEVLQWVRESTRQVMQQARFVKVDNSKLEAFAATLDPAEIRARYYYTEDFHYDSNNGRKLLDYIITLDALNFGSGFSPQWKTQRQGKSTYKNVAATLKAYADAGHALNARFAAHVTAPELAKLFGVAPDFALMPMFAESLNQLGNFVIKEYDGEYANLLDSLPGPELASQLVALLTTNLSCYNDQTTYNSQPVYFYKRAQITVNDLYLAFNGVGFGDFPDVAHLTTFADNLIPHLFRIEGALHYDPALLTRIEQGQLLEAASPEEIEIRAAGVVCVEETCRLINEKSGEDQQIFPAMLDVYLWNRAQSPHYKSHPRHLTETYYY
jgi:hypothetical protein